MITIRNNDDIHEMIESHPILIIECGSASCAPCAGIRARIDNYLHEHNDVKGIYIPIEDNRELCSTIDVFSVPALRVFVCGKLTISETGYFSLDAIFNAIDRYREIMG